MKNILIYTFKRGHSQFVGDFFFLLNSLNTEVRAKTSFDRDSDSILLPKVDLRKKKQLIKVFCQAFKLNKEGLISAYIYDLESNQLLFKTTRAAFPHCLIYEKEKDGEFYSKKFNAKEILNDNKGALQKASNESFMQDR